jgi:retron-type reverse transcriptase
VLGGDPYHVPALEKVMKVDNALAAFEYLKAHGGTAAGVDDIRFDDVSPMEVAAYFRAVREAVLDGSYRPLPTRVVMIPKEDGDTRKLKLQALFDRLVARIAYEALVEYLDLRYKPWSYGFRPRKSPLDLFATVKMGVEVDGLFELAQDDVTKAFDNIPVEPLLETLGDVLPDHKYWDLIAAIVRKVDADGKEVTKGIDQGNALSPLLMTEYLHTRHDTLLEQEVQPPSRTHRYADNIAPQGPDAHECRKILDTSRNLLNRAGLDLKGYNPEKLLGIPVDIRERSLPLLGFDLSAKGNRMHLGVQAKAWQELKDRLEEAHDHPNPPERARELTQGWISAIGPALENRVEKVTRLTYSHIREAGFQGAIPKEALTGWAVDSLRSWERAVLRARRHHGNK